MMEQQNLTEPNNQNLIKKKAVLKGACIGLGVVYLLAILIFIYLFVNQGLKKLPIAVYIPIFSFPLIFLTVFNSLNLVNKEIKVRSLK